MKTKILLTAICILTTYSLAFSQWTGSTTTTGNISRTGNVGIGTTTPTNFLHLELPSGNQVNKGIHVGRSDGYLLLGNGTANGQMFSPQIKGFSTTDWTSPGLSLRGVPYVDDYGYTGVNISGGSQILTKASILTVKNYTTEVFRISAAGNVGIGTTNPGNYKLAVEGKIGAREIQVTTAAWADFVFLKDYYLRPLYEVEEFINENGHLPEIPSAKEVEENGINLGEMDAKLLQKIEELTLYVIELKKEIENLKKDRNK